MKPDQVAGLGAVTELGSLRAGPGIACALVEGRLAGSDSVASTFAGAAAAVGAESLSQCTDANLQSRTQGVGH